MAGYDAKKAALFNQLKQQGVSEDAALAQAGIGDADLGNYALGMNGQMGALVIGSGKVAGVDYVAPTAAESKESARFDQGLQSVNYDVEARNSPSTKTPMTYTTTSTETVSGGGSTVITVGPRQPTPASRALQSSVDGKQAEIDQFNRDNPSNFARKKAGLPPMTPEEAQQRSEKALALSKEKADLVNQQQDATASGEPTVTTTPNTTTTTQTVSVANSSTDTPVQSPGGNDATVNQQTEAQLGVSAVATGGVTDTATTTEDPFEAAQLESEQQNSIEAQLPEDISPEEDPFEAARLEAEQQSNRDELAREENLQVDDTGGYVSTPELEAEQAANRAALSATDEQDAATGKLWDARRQNTIATQRKVTVNNGDWRVRLRLAPRPRADYLYLAPNPGILEPLAQTDGVIFPYTPVISTAYRADYTSTNLTHSNYRGYFYQSSYVDTVTLRCTFTAQSTAEANYLLAVIHFFRSVTKMFYGQDSQRGAPPPLVYLTGLGQYQFAEHPCVVSSFDYILPGDVDYIRAGSGNMNQTNIQDQRNRNSGASSSVGAWGSLLGGALNRLANAGANKGALNPTTPVSPRLGRDNPTYVPTKMEISISLLPMQSRAQVSQEFSLKGFADGNLLRGGFW